MSKVVRGSRQRRDRNLARADVPVLYHSPLGSGVGQAAPRQLGTQQRFYFTPGDSRPLSGPVGTFEPREAGAMTHVEAYGSNVLLTVSWGTGTRESVAGIWPSLICDLPGNVTVEAEVIDDDAPALAEVAFGRVVGRGVCTARRSVDQGARCGTGAAWLHSVGVAFSYSVGENVISVPGTAAELGRRFPCVASSVIVSGNALLELEL